MQEDTVETIVDLAERANALQLRAVCNHFVRNRNHPGFGDDGGNGQNGDEDGEDDAMEEV